MHAISMKKSVFVGHAFPQVRQIRQESKIEVLLIKPVDWYK